MGNKIVHAEVVGKDAPALHKFWGGLFGWKQNTDLPGGYAMTDAADSGIVLGTGPSPDGGAGWVTFYVSVPDLDATLAKVQELGGSALGPAHQLEGVGRFAVVADPHGATFGVIAGEPPEE